MEDGNTQEELNVTSPKPILTNEPKVRKTGFHDPEVQKKAQEASLAKRRAKHSGQLVLTNSEAEHLNSFAEGDFKPTKAMLLCMQAALDPETGMRVSEWLERAKLSRSLWYVWEKQVGFKKWWKKTFEEKVKELTHEWLALGVKKMHGTAEPHTFNYWKTMGEKVFGFANKLVLKEEKSEQEEELTETLLEVMKKMNVALTKPVHAVTEAINTESSEILTEAEIKELNNMKEI